MDNSKNQSVTVLIVEDEHLIRIDLVSFLEAEGFAVYEANNAAEAIRLLELHEEIRLIFTDINMPGSMDGLALAHYVRGRWPPVKIIVTSGYVKVQGTDLPVGALYIGKPYQPEHIAHRMKELMDISWTLTRMRPSSRCTDPSST
jgi:two-component system, response regulator PdtaR